MLRNSVPGHTTRACKCGTTGVGSKGSSGSPLSGRSRPHPLRPRRRFDEIVPSGVRSTPITPSLLPSKAGNGLRPAIGGCPASYRSPLSRPLRRWREGAQGRHGAPSFCMADSRLLLEGAEDPAFTALQVKTHVLGGAAAGAHPAYRRTAAWSLSSRWGTLRCRGRGRWSACASGAASACSIAAAVVFAPKPDG